MARTLIEIDDEALASASTARATQPAKTHDAEASSHNTQRTVRE